MVLFYLEQLRLATHCRCPMGEGVGCTKFGCPTVSTGQYEVGFLYTVMDSVPSASGLTMVSKNGMDPSSLLSSTVNLMAGSTLFMCWRKPCLLKSLWMTKVSSTNLCQNLGGGWGHYLELFIPSTPCRGWPTMGLTGETMAVPSTCS